MKTSKSISFPYYSGNIKLTKVIGRVTLEKFVYAHKNPILETKELIRNIREVSEDGNLELKRMLKQKLFAFTPAVNIEVGVCRKYENIANWTGLMQLDFDKIETIEKAHDIKEYLFTTYQCIVCCYMSPSGKGVKALARIPVPKDATHYKAIHKSIQAEFEQLGYFDPATKNGVLPLFLSYDEDMYYRDYSEAEAWPKVDWGEEKKVQLLDKPPTSFSKTARDNSEAQYNYDKCIRIFTEAMSRIVDNGHPQLRTACLILGSRAGAGYIDLQEAIILAKNMVHSNSYFDKDERGYIDTSAWAINEGYKSPKYYR